MIDITAIDLSGYRLNKVNDLLKQAGLIFLSVPYPIMQLTKTDSKWEINALARRKNK
jgi:hypothetical protein